MYKKSLIQGKKMKKNYLIIFIIILLILSCSKNNNISTDTIKISFNSKTSVIDEKTISFESISSIQLSEKLITGWNLGNTLDATNANNLSSETSWGMPHTTKEMISNLKKSGITTIRIPVSWHNHIIDKQYTIDPKWMARVKQIVDWAIEENMYVIINSHHDNYLQTGTMPKCAGYYPYSTNYDESANFILNIWSQICLAFNNGYDSHLIFETMNEPRLAGTTYEWYSDNSDICKDAFNALNKLNQLAVDTIRKSGGNNLKRIIIIPSLQASVGSALSPLFKIPKDDYEAVDYKKILISVHMYTPYSFAMEMPGETIFTEKHKNEISYNLSKIDNLFNKTGYGVIIGEYGATNKDNDEERIKWFSYYLSEAKKHNIPAILWDNGQFLPSQTEGERYGYFVRETGVWYSSDIQKAILENTK